MPRPITATLDSSALLHNYQVAKKCAPNSQVLAVLKANAYGHGIEFAGMTLLNTADGFAVLDFNEAIILRRLGFNGRILMLEGVFAAEDLQVCAQYSLDIVVATAHHLQILVDCANYLSTPIKCNVKVRSQINRLGFSVEEALSVWAKLLTIANVQPIEWMIHFANADLVGNKSDVDFGLDIIQTLCAKFPANVSASNSAAILQHPRAHFNTVRAGIMLYGSSPTSLITADSFGLKPVMSLTSEVLAVFPLKSGQSLGYGSIYTATKDIKVAVVACGYADGYPRHIKNGAPVWISQICPLIGRVSMDMVMVDVTNLQQVLIGNSVELWGLNIMADCVASWADTISYQLFCNITNRVNKKII